MKNPDCTPIDSSLGVPLDAAHAATASRSPARRWAEALAFLGAWMGLGRLLRLDANAYLALGVPLTLAFQVLVRKTPVRALWVWSAPRLQLGKVGIGITLALAVLPLVEAASMVARGHAFAALTAVAGALGAVGAGYAIPRLERRDARPTWITLATSGVLGVLVMIAGAMVVPQVGRTVWGRLGLGVVSLVEYLGIAFAVEEVTFRGALDAHVHVPGERGGVLSAVVLSALWGLWHLPIIASVDWKSASAVAVLHGVIGVGLTWGMRRSGNLFVPVLTHALIDAVRNALLGVPH